VTPETSSATSPAAQPSHRRLRWWWIGLAGLLVVGAALVSAAAWLWHSGPAQVRLLESVAGVRVEGVTGRATGGAFAIERLQWQGTGLVVEVDGLQWQDLSWRWRPHAGAWVGLAFEQLQARAVRVTRQTANPPVPATPLQAPASLRLPLALSAPGLTVDAVRLDGQNLLSSLRADLDLAADGGASHQLKRLRLSRDGLQVTGDLSIGSDGDLPLTARLALATPTGQPLAWQAAVGATGPLSRLQVDVQLRTEAGATLDSQATVTAFADWPLAALLLKAQSLDLSRLAPGLPETALSGTAELGDVSAGQPLRLQMALNNAKPGPWDAGRLPVRSAKGTLQGRPSAPERLVFDRWVLGFGRSPTDGQLALSGTWDRAQLELQGQLQAVQIAQLDTRAPRATVDGPLTVSLTGLAAPGGPAANGPQPIDGKVTLDLQGLVAATATAGRPAAKTTAGRPTAKTTAGRPVTTATAGRPTATTGQTKPEPMRLRSDLGFSLPTDGSLSLAVHRLEAAIGAAKASAELDARRDVAGAWALKSSGQLDHVDLAAWWPDAGPSDLNGQWRADLQLPPVPPAALLEALRGSAALDLQRSQLSGVALSGTAKLKAGAQGLVVEADLQGAGNRLQLNGTSDGAVPTAGGRQVWRADVQAPALQALAPLLRRIPGAQGWLPEAGALQATATATGRWPAWRSEGQLQVDGLRLPQGRLDQGKLRWTLNGLTLDAPIELDADLSGLAQGARRIDHVRARLDGSLREHRLRLDADGAVRPPAWTDAVNGAGTGAGSGRVTGAATGAMRGSTVATGARTAGVAPVVSVASEASTTSATAATLATVARRASTTSTASPSTPSPAAAPATETSTPAPGSALQVQAQGRWLPASPSAATAFGAGVWRGSVSTLRAGPRAAGAEPWLLARNLSASVTLDAQSQPTEAQLAPGRVEVFGGALAWQQAQWQAPERPGAAPRITLDAQLEPLKVAPILARLQPEFGWHGDLVVGGRATVRSGARFDADIAIERQGGDLGLTLAGSRRDLGLTTLRLALAAHDGAWVVSQAVVGQQVGVFAGSQQLQAAPGAVWPADQTPLEGGFSLQVGDASIWAPWLPPGWRLGGKVSASLSLGGQLGAPTATGELLGEQLLVRNIFEGINLQDGALRVRLDRSQAVIETFRFKGSDGGSLDLQGRIAYADTPQADLKLVLDKFRALGRVDRRVSLSGNADLGLRAGRLSVQGRFSIDEGLIDVTADDAPSLGDDVVVVGRTDAKGRPLAVVDGGDAAKQGVLARTDIDLRVALGDALRLRGRGLDTLLGGQLRITTAADGKLVVRGVVNTAEGSYTAYGQNLAIKRGSISFTGDVANPRLDILALRADIDNPVGVIVSGFAVDPRVRLYSDPDLPEVDQLTWLLTGQAPQGQGRDESALLQRAALALLAGDRGASDAGFLQKLGIDQLGVGRSDGGDTVVKIGKQLSKRLSIVYEKGLSAAGGTWALLYRIAGRTTLRAHTGVDNAVEVIWTWRWD
jgi:translocation and assembly module TamB